jgi:hypothetical protein
LNFEFRYFPIIPSLVTTTLYGYYEERKPKQETPICRAFGCKKEDVFLGVSVSELLDEYDIPFASEDYETTCVRCFKVFGYKYIATVR